MTTDITLTVEQLAELEKKLERTDLADSERQIISGVLAQSRTDFRPMDRDRNDWEYTFWSYRF